MDWNRRELEDVRVALDRYLHTLREELASTDARDMREGLRELIGRYELLLARVESELGRMLAAA